MISSFLLPIEPEVVGTETTTTSGASSRRRYASCRKCGSGFKTAGYGAQSPTFPQFCGDCEAWLRAFDTGRWWE